MKRSLFNIFLGLGLALLLAGAAGENPWHVLKVIFNSAFGSSYDLGLTLFYVTPLIFTGLAVAVAFHAGLFNIGAEGQLTIAALAVAGVAFYFPDLPMFFAITLSMIMALLCSGLWGAIPGWLKAYRGSHEVVVTIMMNFIAFGLASWLITGPWHSASSQNPETNPVGSNYYLRPHDSFSSIFDGAPVSSALILAVLVAIAIWLFLYRTKQGFMFRTVGANESAARSAGFPVKKTQIQAMALGGALAGLVVVGEIYLHAGKLSLGFSPDYGFIGIAVALLARNNPLGIIFSAFLFAALHKGAGDLDMETERITRDFSLVIQAIILLFASIGVGFRKK